MDYDKNTPVNIFKIPTLNLGQKYFYTLGILYNSICDSPLDNIAFDFKECKFINPIFLSYIGGIKEYFKAKGKRIFICIPDENKKVGEYLISSGFRRYFDSSVDDKPLSPCAIPFSRMDTLDEPSVIQYIDSIIDLAPIRLSDTAKQQIFQNIFEIFANATEHSEQVNGVYSCGHWLPKQKELFFSVYDTGIGIPQKIKNVYHNMSSFEAFVWAMKPGNSTLQLNSGVPRGLGLHSLEEFISLNGGTLHIYSNDIYYRYPHKGRVGVLPFNNIGTLISIQIKADDRLYLYQTKGNFNG